MVERLLLAESSQPGVANGISARSEIVAAQNNSGIAHACENWLA